MKRHPERQKAKKVKEQRLAESASLADIIRLPFFECFNRHGEDLLFKMCMDTAGIEPRAFNDGSGPRSATGDVEASFEENPEDSVYRGQTNSLAQAEIMIGQLIDATAALARIVNDYKRDEIEARIA